LKTAESGLYGSKYEDDPVKGIPGFGRDNTVEYQVTEVGGG